MKFQSQIVASASGSIGGCTYSRNRSGQYIRRRAMPVNPGSAFAQIITAALATLVTRWTSILTVVQRAAWDLWAINTPQTDALGNPLILTGQNAYVMMNTPRIQNTLAVVDTAPAIFAGTALTAPAVTIASQATQRFTVTFANTDEWAIAVGGALNIYASRPQNQSINFFKGPYRFVTAIPGAVVPPASPFITAAVNTPFPFVINQKLFFQFRSVAPDARISSIKRAQRIAVA